MAACTTEEQSLFCPACMSRLKISIRTFHLPTGKQHQAEVIPCRCLAGFSVRRDVNGYNQHLAYLRSIGHRIPVTAEWVPEEEEY